MTVQDARHCLTSHVGVGEIVIDTIAGLIAGKSAFKKLLNRTKGGLQKTGVLPWKMGVKYTGNQRQTIRSAQ